MGGMRSVAAPCCARLPACTALPSRGQAGRAAQSVAVRCRARPGRPFLRRLPPCLPPPARLRDARRPRAPARLPRRAALCRAAQLPDGQASVEARPEKELTSEIQAIIRQITASVTFLPLLDEPCSFDLLVRLSARCGCAPRTRASTDAAAPCPPTAELSRPSRPPCRPHGAGLHRHRRQRAGGVGGERPKVHRQVGGSEAALVYDKDPQGRRGRLVPRRG